MLPVVQELLNTWFCLGQCQLTTRFSPIFLAGTIPESLAKLGKLEVLNLNYNRLSGHFFILFCWSVPYNQPIFRSILRREHPRVSGKPGGFGVFVPATQPTFRSVSPFLGWSVPTAPDFSFNFMQGASPSPSETWQVWATFKN